MTDGKDGHYVVINAITRNVPAIPEVDHPFAEVFWKVVDRAANVWVASQKLDAANDGLTRAAGSIRAFRLQEIPKPPKIADCSSGINYLWHSGAGNSLSEPQLASHFSTSSAVACRPVA